MRLIIVLETTVETTGAPCEAGLTRALTVVAGDSPTKDDYADLSRLLQKMVLKQVPREYEEKFDWGTSIPVPPKLLAPGLPRWSARADA